MQHRHTLVAVAAALALLPSAQAIGIDTPDPDLKVRPDLTPEYSLGCRLKNPSDALTRFDVAVDPGTVNEDDGDHNFRRGPISNRLDLLAEFDISAKNFGARLSGNGWRDSVYLRSNKDRGTEIHASGMPTGTGDSAGAVLATVMTLLARNARGPAITFQAALRTALRLNNH